MIDKVCKYQESVENLPYKSIVSKNYRQICQKMDKSFLQDSFVEILLKSH